MLEVGYERQFFLLPGLFQEELGEFPFYSDGSLAADRARGVDTTQDRP